MDCLYFELPAFAIIYSTLLLNAFSDLKWLQWAEGHDDFLSAVAAAGSLLTILLLAALLLCGVPSSNFHGEPTTWKMKSAVFLALAICGYISLRFLVFKDRIYGFIRIFGRRYRLPKAAVRACDTVDAIIDRLNDGPKYRELAKKQAEEDRVLSEHK